MNSMLLVMTSCQNTAEAQRIGKQLLKARLAACVQIVQSVDSFYYWPPDEPVINQSKEVLLVVKTLESKWNKLEQLIQILHSYDTPEIIALPVVHANERYLAWLTSELS